MYLDLPERSVTELGELYDYAETPEWKKTPVRHQPSSRRNSSRSSGTSRFTIVLSNELFNLSI